MNRKTIYTALILATVTMIGFSLYYFVNDKKVAFYSEGGFNRHYLPISSELKLVAPLLEDEDIYRFSNSTNSDFAIGLLKKSLVKITFEDDKLISKTIYNVPIFPKNEYFSDDTNENIYVLTMDHLITNSLKLYPGYSKRINNTSKFNSKNFEPVIFENNQLICARGNKEKWHFQFQNSRHINKNKMSLTKLVDQGKIQHDAPSNTFIYVSLFSNEIVQYDSVFNINC